MRRSIFRACINSRSFETKPKIVSSKDAKVISTSIPTVFTADILDPYLSFDSYKPTAKKIYSNAVKYVTPEEFNYDLPVRRTMELAFVGKSNVVSNSANV